MARCGSPSSSARCGMASSGAPSRTSRRHLIRQTGAHRGWSFGLDSQSRSRPLGAAETLVLTSYLVLTKMRGVNAAATTRLTADERRGDVINAAMKEFALGGFAGTSTQAIANRVGVSQPYLFQLYRTKKDLFVAVVRECFARTRSAFEASAKSAREATDDPDQVLHAMGMRYIDLLRDRQMLRLQLHAYAACEDPD